MGNSSDTHITNDLRYGKVNKFTYENSLIIQKVIDFKNAPDQLANCIHRCQLSQSINHKNIIQLHKYEVDQLSVSIYFEHYDYDLYSLRIQIKIMMILLEINQKMKNFMYNKTFKKENLIIIITKNMNYYRCLINQFQRQPTSNNNKYVMMIQIK